VTPKGQTRDPNIFEAPYLLIRARKEKGEEERAREEEGKGNGEGKGKGKWGRGKEKRKWKEREGEGKGEGKRKVEEYSFKNVEHTDARTDAQTLRCFYTLSNAMHCIDCQL